MSLPDNLSDDQWRELVDSLREEIVGLKEELRRVRRDNYEAPPHYL